MFRCLTYSREDIERLDFDAALGAISPQRRAYILRYRHDMDRRLCLAATLLLQQALHEEFGIPSLPPLVYAPQGKPYIEGRPDIHFSLSHCRELAACVVSSQPVGIDVESIGAYDEDVAMATMNVDELQRIARSAWPDVAFTRLWTMKESFLKLTGEGLRNDMKDVLADAADYSFACQEHPDEGYVLTLCQKRLATKE